MRRRDEAKSEFRGQNRAPQAMQSIVAERDTGIWALMSRSRRVVNNPG